MVVRVNGIEPAQTQQFRRRHAGKSRPLATHVIAAAIGGGGPNKLGQGLHQTAPFGLALLQLGRAPPHQRFHLLVLFLNLVSGLNVGGNVGGHNQPGRTAECLNVMAGKLNPNIAFILAPTAQRLAGPMAGRTLTKFSFDVRPFSRRTNGGDGHA